MIDAPSSAKSNQQEVVKTTKTHFFHLFTSQSYRTCDHHHTAQPAKRGGGGTPSGVHDTAGFCYPVLTLLTILHITPVQLLDTASIQIQYTR